jgi:hypothetical protein
LPPPVHAFYNPATGRWLTRDPSGEGSGANLHAAAGNDLANRTDKLGLWATPVHHQIVEDWLTDPKYRHYPWHCCDLDVIDLIQRGSDQVDGVGFANWPHWCEAQSSALAYQHAMRDGRWNQSDREAGALYAKFITENLFQAVALADYAKQNGRCHLEEWALIRLGRAYHSVSDSLSPAHAGFQPWWGPFEWWPDFSFEGYVAFLEEHEGQETMAVYQSQRTAVVSALDKRFRLFLDWILRD